jgi:type II secretory pathway component PulF
MLSNKTWWIILGVIASVVFILYQKKGSSFLSSFIKELKNCIPIFKRLALSQELAHFSHALSLLLKSGVPALRSLEVSTPTIEDTKLRQGLENVCKDVTKGESLSKSMKNQTGLPDFFTKMIAVGEESGRLAEVLDEITHSYTQQVDSDIALIASLLEPILILVFGLILGSIVLSILLPTFQITQFVH